MPSQTPPNAPMSLAQQFVAVCAAVIGGSVAYVACDFGGWPRLTYDPHARRWAFVEGVVTGAPMPYVGMLLWGALGFAVAGAIAAVTVRATNAVPSPGAVALAGAWALTAVCGAAAYFLWNLWPF